MADKTTGWVIELVAGQVVSPWDIKRLSEFIDVGVSERASLEAENRELQEKLTKFEEDGAKGKGYSGSSGMVHRIDILKKQAAVANARIDQLDRLNEALLRNRNYDPGAGNVLNEFLDELDRWKIKAEAAEAQVRKLQWKPITPEQLPKVGDEVGGWFGYPTGHWEVRPYKLFLPISPVDIYAGLILAGWKQYRTMLTLPPTSSAPELEVKP